MAKEYHRTFLSRLFGCFLLCILLHVALSPLLRQWKKENVASQNFVHREKPIPWMGSAPLNEHKTHHEKPTPWDGLAPLNERKMLSIGEKCDLQYLVPKSRKYAVPKIKVCLRPYPDVVSSTIRAVGRWASCDEHVKGFMEASSEADGIHVLERTRGVFLEAGANIGACTLTLLAAGASVVAFEPSPSNLFYLTSSILANQKEFPDWSSRLVLYPVALGDERKSSVIYESRGNAGNSALSKPIGESGREISKFHAGNEAIVKHAFDVPVWRLDDVVSKTSHGPVRLMKMDVQGYETRLLRGGRKFFESRSAKYIHYELAFRWLKAQGTSAAELHRIVMESGYIVTSCGNMRPKDKKESIEVSDIETLPESTLLDCEAVRRNDSYVTKL